MTLIMEIFQKYIHFSKIVEIDGSKADWITQLSGSKHAIVNITNLDDVLDAVIFLTCENFVQFYEKTPLLLFIFIKFDHPHQRKFKPKDIVTLEKYICRKADRPVVLVFEKETCSEIYYKEVSDTKFKSFCISENEQTQSLAKKPEFVLTFAEAFRILKYDQKPKLNKEIELKEMFMTAISGQSLLSLSFLKLFKISIDEKAVELAVQTNNTSKIAVILDRPFNEKPNSIQNEKTEKKKLAGLILLEAVKRGNEKIVGYILNCFVDSFLINETNEGSSTEKAFNLKHYEILADLLEADFLFPKHFALDLIPEDSRLKCYADEVENFHENIVTGNLYCCKKFVKDNPMKKFACNTMNESALKTALDSHNLKIFAFLESHFFKENHGENLEHKILELSDDSRKELFEARLLFCKPQTKNYLYDLIKKSSYKEGKKNATHEEHENYIELIEKCFKTLDKISIVSTIMKIISRAKVLNIRFLFDSEFLHSFEPSPTEETHGVTHPNEKVIVFGAKFLMKHETFLEGLSFLAHEMGHLAMYSIFQNDGKPYFPGNTESALKFQTIVEKCGEMCSNNADACEIIDNVYSTGYSQEKMINELIVCVPELYAFYMNNNKALEGLSLRFRSLFKFYELVEKIFKLQLPFVGVKQEAQELNKSYGKLEELEEFRLNFSSNLTLTTEMKSLMKEDIIPTNKVKVYFTNKPQVFLNTIYTEFHIEFKQLVSSLCIFATLKTVDYQKYFKEAINFLQPDLLPTLVIDASDYDKTQHSARYLLNLIKMTSKTIIVAEHGTSREFLEIIADELDIELSQKALNF